MKSQKFLTVIIPIFLFLICFCSVLPQTFLQPLKAASIKQYYTKNDLVAYFKNVVTGEGYYLTNVTLLSDGTRSPAQVVKADFWWGGRFNISGVDYDTLKKEIDYIYPEPTVYYGLIPKDFLVSGERIILKLFIHTDGRVFTNEEPFKNIFGNNPPQPPEFKELNTSNYQYLSENPNLMSREAKLLLDRMSSLSSTIATYKRYGTCAQVIAPRSLVYYDCWYEQLKSKPYIPPAYTAL